MNKRGVKWLYQELPELMARGVLTEGTAGKLREYYGEINLSGKRFTAVIICGVVGALLIGLGIIALFAHNWEQFSRFTRMVLSVSPMLMGQGLVLWVLWKRPKSAALKEGSATFLALMVGASIALISQTYHISSDAGTFVLTWMLLIAPLIYLMQASLPAAIYLIGITVYSGAYCWVGEMRAVLFCFLAAVAVPHFIWSLHRDTYTIRSTIISFVMAVCVSFAAGYVLEPGLYANWPLIYSSLYVILYSLGYRKFSGITSNWQKPLRIIGAIGIIIIAFQMTYQYGWGYADKGRWHFFNLMTLPNQIMTLLLVSVAILLCYDYVKRKDLNHSLFTALPLLIFATLLFRCDTILFMVLIMFVFNLYILALSVGRIISGIRNNSLMAINTGMLILGILIIMRFFDSGINLIMKGLAFIAVGSGFLAVNLVFGRRIGGAK